MVGESGRRMCEWWDRVCELRESGEWVSDESVGRMCEYWDRV